MADTAVERKVKPEKPDEEAFKAQQSKLQNEHEALMKKLNEVKAKLDLAKPGNKSADSSVPLTPIQQKQADLKKELASIKATQSSKKSSKQTLFDRQKAINDSINSKIAAQKLARAKVSYKSVTEIESQIERLQSQVDSGTLKLVDERKALADISQLNKQKKSFAGFDESQASIDKDKATLAELRKQLDDPEVKALSERFTEIQKELDAIKAEQDTVYQNLSGLRDERTRLQNEQQAKFQEIRALKDSHYQAKSAFRDYEQEAWKVRKEKQKVEREQYEKERKMKFANQLLEDASIKAFTEEIITCENLINYFDPENATKKTDGPVSQFAASIGRTVTDQPKGMKVLKKEEEDDYFIGGSGKKKGKKKGKGGDAATPAVSAGKISLSIGVLGELAKVDVAPPMGPEEIPTVVEKLKEKLQHYKENQEKATKDNIAKAQAEIDKLEKAEKPLEDAVADLAVEDKPE